MEIVPLGDSALLLRPESDFEKAPARALESILHATERLKTAQIPGLIELVPAYTTIALFFDLARVVDAGAPINEIVGWLTMKIETALRGASKKKQSQAISRLVEIPVCYDSEFGFDLEEVARRANVSLADVVQLHIRAEYRVHCVGFTPGFGFLSGLDAKLATPRRATPRTEVPAGSVAIGGKQTGVYPIQSPGGWNVIGRTPLRMFDVERKPPTLLHAGDRVRFRSITRSEFDSLGK
jgi:inhibitor of KinA